MKGKLFFLILFILLISCIDDVDNSKLENQTDKNSISENIEIYSLLNFFNENKPNDFDLLILQDGSYFLNRETSITFKINEIEQLQIFKNKNYFVIFNENQSLKICIANRSNNTFEVLPYSMNNSFAEKHRTLGWVVPDGDKQNTFNLYIYNFDKCKLVFKHLYEYYVHDFNSDSDLFFNNVHVDISYDEDSNGIGIYRIFPTQGNYTFNDDIFAIESEKLYQSWHTDVKNEPIEWIEESFQISDNQVLFPTMGSYSLDQDYNNIKAASVTQRGYLTIIHQTEEKSENASSYELICFNKQGQEYRKFQLPNLFPISDDIINIYSIPGDQSNAFFIIETSEFNYDLRINSISNIYTIQLRYKDFNMTAK